VAKLLKNQANLAASAVLDGTFRSAAHDACGKDGMCPLMIAEDRRAASQTSAHPGKGGGPWTMIPSAVGAALLLGRGTGWFHNINTTESTNHLTLPSELLWVVLMQGVPLSHDKQCLRGQKPGLNRLRKHSDWLSAFLHNWILPSPPDRGRIKDAFLSWHSHDAIE
jgi:hypothetical protein